MKHPGNIGLVLLLFSAMPVFADGQDNTLELIGNINLTLIVITALVVATALALLFRFIYERTRKEKRRTVILMVLGTLIPPALVAYENIEGSLTSEISRTYGYAEGDILYNAILLLLGFAGFNIGYFLTPRKKEQVVTVRSNRQKVIGIGIQFCCWLVVLGLQFYGSSHRALDAIKADKLDEKLQLAEQGTKLQYVKMVLDKNYKNVRWEKIFKAFKAKRADGTLISVSYDSISGKYSMSYLLKEPLAITDTTGFINHALNLGPFLNSTQFEQLKNEIKSRNYSLSIPREPGRFVMEMHFTGSNIDVLYVSEMQLIQLRWMPRRPDPV